MLKQFIENTTSAYNDNDEIIDDMYDDVDNEHKGFALFGDDKSNLLSMKERYKPHQSVPENLDFEQSNIHRKAELNSEIRNYLDSVLLKFFNSNKLSNHNEIIHKNSNINSSNQNKNKCFEQEITNETGYCFICKKQLKNSHGLAIHFGKMHKDLKEYILFVLIFIFFIHS